jgi:hypothetical protein
MSQPPFVTETPEIAKRVSSRPAPAPATASGRPPASERPAAEVDARLDAAAKVIATGDWRALAEALGPLDQATTLPPTLGLLCALAHHETASDESAQAANELAIRCVGGLFSVAPSSAISMVIAKRLLRKNPVTWRARPAPPAKTSILIVALTLVVGGGVGWLLTSNVIHVVRAKLGF